MYILGIGGSVHDFSACITKNAELLYMIEDERITRNKHGKELGASLSQGFSRKYCLKAAELEKADLIIANDIVNPAILFRLQDVNLINHHLAHAASAFFCSPFEESAIIVVDSVGSSKMFGDNKMYESMTFAYGKGNHIEVIESNYGKNIAGTDYIENSLGIFYSLVTEIIGFGELQDGKTMGLAPFGSEKMYIPLKKMIDCDNNGKIHLSRKNILKILDYKKEILAISDSQKKFEVCADFAYAVQKILEEIMIVLCHILRKKTGCKNVCIAGGVGLNSVANYKIYKQGIFDKMFIQPAAGDNGTSIGAALYGYYQLCNSTRKAMI